MKESYGEDLANHTSRVQFNNLDFCKMLPPKSSMYNLDKYNLLISLKV